MTLQKRMLMGTVLLVLCIMSFVSPVARAGGLLASGTWGASAWSIDGDGVLTIQAGQMPDSGTPPWRDAAYAATITSVVVQEGAKTGASAAGLFRGLRNVITIDVSKLDTSAATTITHMFEGNLKLESVNVTGLVHDGVTSIYGAFQNIRPNQETGVEITGLETWDVSNVTNMHETFRTSVIKSLKNIEGWNTAHVEILDSFLYDSRITQQELLDFSGWDISSVTDLNFAFGNLRIHDYSIAGWEPQGEPDRLERAFGGNMSRLDLSVWNNLYIPAPPPPGSTEAVVRAFVSKYGDVFWVGPKVILLNPDFKFYERDGFTFTPPNNAQYTGLWQAVGDGTEEEPLGDTYTTEQLRALYTGAESIGPLETYVWQTKVTTIAVGKMWQDADNQDGVRPNAVTVRLLADGDDTGETLVLNALNGWKGSFIGPSTTPDGKVIDYGVAEAPVGDGYAPVITGSHSEGFTITNVRTPETVDVAGTKTWADANNEGDKRPASITIHLHKQVGDAGTILVESKTISSADTWQWRFADLPRYEDATEIVYTITEDPVNGYTQAVSGYNVTNAYVSPPPTPQPTPQPTPSDHPTAEPTQKPLAEATYPTLHVPLAVKKVLQNGVLQTRAFTFQLKDAAGRAVTATNQADGNVVFPDRTFSKVVSNYLYTIR